MAKTKQERTSEIAMISVTIIWGMGFPISKIALNYGFDVFTVTASRFLVAVIFLALIFHKRLKFIDKKYLVPGLVAGILLFIGYFFQLKGLQYTSPANNAFLTQMAVVFTPFIFWIGFRTTPGRHIFIAAFIAFIGVFILIGNIDLRYVNVGDLLTLGCAISVSIQMVVAQHFMKKYSLDPVLFTFCQLIIVLILSSFAAFTLEELPSPITPIMLWPLVFLGIFNTAIGFSVQAYAIKHLNSTRVSIIVSLEALVGALSATIILGDPITINLIVGGLLIILAIFISEQIIKLPSTKKLKQTN